MFSPGVDLRLIGRQWAPCGVLYIARGAGEPLAYPPVARYGGELAAPADLGLVEDHLAIGRVGWGIVERAVGEDLDLARRELERCDAVAAALALHEREGLAVGAVARAHVVGALEGEALRRASRGGHLVD